MTNIAQTASLLEVSSKLQTASICLKQLTTGKRPNSSEELVLKWAGELFIQMDWQSKYPKQALGASLAVQAASTRPTFYDALTKLIPHFKSERDIIDFLKGLYKTLETGGAKPQLTPDRLCMASDLLKGLSQSLIAEISNNGLPKQKIWITTGAIN